MPEVSPPPFPENFQPSHPADFRVGKAQVEWSHGIPAAALAGVIGSFLMMVPLGALGPAMIAAGVLAVVFYARRLPAATLTAGIGAKLGMLGGGIGFSIFTVLGAILTIVFGPERTRAAMIEAVEKSQAGNPDPNFHQALEFMKTPEGLAFVIVLGTVTLLVFSLALSAAGGAITGSYLRRRSRP